jgi:hypothetical protein
MPVETKKKKTKLNGPTKLGPRLRHFMEMIAKRFKLEVIYTGGSYDLKKNTYVFSIPNTMTLVYSIKYEINGEFLTIDDNPPIKWTRDLEGVNSIFSKIPDQVKRRVNDLRVVRAAEKSKQ